MNRTCLRTKGTALATALLAGTGAVVDSPAAPITFNTALPVAKGEFITRVQYVTVESGDDPSDLNRDFDAKSLVGVLGWGASRDLALFAVAPYVDKDLDLTMGGQRRHRGADGLGDVSVFGRYTVYQKDWLGRTLRAAPFLGVKAPTGSDDKRDGEGRLPPSVQPGSGSWDGFGGVVGTYQTLDYQIDAQIAYRASSEANDFRAGNELRADASLQYRLWPRTLGTGVPGFLYGVLEANLFLRDKNRVNGNRDSDSGGTTMLIAPGIQYVTRRLILEAAIQLPVAQDLHGDALELDYIARGGFRFNF
jgi:hypothetical protein